MELYVERGFENTTVAEIAERAGLTERTFFRHFADKREVLFAGSEALRDLLADSVSGAPSSAAPIEVVVGALEAVGAVLQERADWSKQRQAVIAANAELRERELIKLAGLAETVREALRHARGKGPDRHPHSRGRDRRLQGGVRTMGPTAGQAQSAPADPGVLRRAPDHHRRLLTLTRAPQWGRVSPKIRILR